MPGMRVPRIDDQSSASMSLFDARGVGLKDSIKLTLEVIL